MCQHKKGFLAVLLSAGLLLGCSDDPATPRQDDNTPLNVPVYVTEFDVVATAMTADDNGNLLFCYPFKNRIIQYTVTGDSIGECYLFSQADSALWPIYMEYYNGTIVVVSALPEPSRIVVYDSLGTLQREWLEWHAHDSGWAGGNDQIAIDRDGYIYTLRFYEETVVKYAPNGTFEREWMTHGTNPTGYSWPGGIVVGPNDIVYIADTVHNRVLMFSNIGEFIGEFGTSGSGKGQFSWPNGLGIDNRNVLYVVDRLNHRVQMLTLDGEYIAEFSTGVSLKTPLLITIQGNNIHILHEDGVVEYFKFVD